MSQASSAGSRQRARKARFAEGPRLPAECVCGKRPFASRKEAKSFARSHHPGHSMSAYVCERDNRYFHFGHLPDSVRDGRLTRDDLGYTAPRHESHVQVELRAPREFPISAVPPVVPSPAEVAKRAASVRAGGLHEQ